MEKTNIWLVIKNIEKGYTFTKYFYTEYEKDRFKIRLHHIPYFILIEDSSEIDWNYE